MVSRPWSSATASAAGKPSEPAGARRRAHEVSPRMHDHIGMGDAAAVGPAAIGRHDIEEESPRMGPLRRSYDVTVMIRGGKYYLEESRTEDPMFEGAANQNFRLHPDSPALALQAVDWRQRRALLVRPCQVEDSSPVLLRLLHGHAFVVPPVRVLLALVVRGVVGDVLGLVAVLTI